MYQGLKHYFVLLLLVFSLPIMAAESKSEVIDVSENIKTSVYEYLKYLRSEVGKLIEDDGDMLALKKIDQSKYKHLHNFDALNGKNIQKVFTEMEFE